MRCEPREVLAAGVVDGHIDAALAGERRVNERRDLVLLAHVAGLGPAAPGRAQREGLAQRRVTAPTDDDERADSGHILGDRPAEAAATARHRDDATVEKVG